MIDRSHDLLVARQALALRHPISSSSAGSTTAPELPVAGCRMLRDRWLAKSFAVGRLHVAR